MINLIKSNCKLPVFEELKKGDKVRVKQGLVGGNRYGNLYFNHDMEGYCGKEIIVVDWIEQTTSNDHGIIPRRIHTRNWQYSKEMLEVI